MRSTSDRENLKKSDIPSGGISRYENFLRQIAVCRKPVCREPVYLTPAGITFAGLGRGLFRQESSRRKSAHRLSLLLVQAMFFVLLLSGSAFAEGRKIAFFVGDVDAFTIFKSLEKMKDLKDKIDISVFTEDSINADATGVLGIMSRMDAAVVDIMPPRPSEWILENRNSVNPAAKIYAVRSSSHNQDFADAGFIMKSDVKGYFNYTCEKNIEGIIRRIADRDLGIETKADPPVIPPDNALYHPDAPELFSGMADYMKWYRESGHFKERGLWNLSIIFPTFALDGKNGPLSDLIHAYEAKGINTVTWFRQMQNREKNLEDLISSDEIRGKLGSITGFDFKFTSTLSGNIGDVLKKANVPVFNAQYLFFNTGEEWLASPQGVSPADMTLQFSTPEISGLIEPTVIGVKELVKAADGISSAYIYKPVTPNLEKLARRAASWHTMKDKSNSDKKVVLIYYNHGGGKQNIGASYLNVFRSIEKIVQQLKHDGYTITGDLNEEKIKDLLIRSGRNIGSWAPGELDRLTAEGNAEFITVDEYRKWLERTPSEFRDNVEKDWGDPVESKIMVQNGKFVIPCIKLGNLTLVPQPSRGWCDDPQKLYHSTTLQPHHQYTAFYLWLQNVVKPDALINLGTHGTHEWLPGKEAGLTWKCAPEVLIGDIPSLYPYIVDDVGEGIQAKRRGRGVVIDHAVPPLRKGGIYEEYSKLAALISEYEASSSGPIKESKLDRIKELALELGLDKDLGITELLIGTDEKQHDDLEKIEHYIISLKTEMVPYGLHTFGVSPSGDEQKESAAAMNPENSETEKLYLDNIAACGPSEMASLMNGLSGGYIPAGPGNDPVRNPESLPTGRNFYGFDPEKTPSKEAWENGKKAAQDIIGNYRKKHDGKYPQQIGVVLWSVETIRDEGINISTALYLMGMKPVWDRRDKVRSVAAIPGRELQRPRIDVLLQMSGLFRDSFAAVALLLDRAVKDAAKLSDVENFVRLHADEMKSSLIKEGKSPEEAEKLSLIRLFSAPPGAYGTKVDDLAGGSGLWEDDDVVAEQGFIQVQSHGYSSDTWGEKMTPVYRTLLKNVDATVHTISSNLYGTMDNDDMFQYLGGLSMAVRKESGKDPDTFISMQRRKGAGEIQDLEETLGREMRSRYLNPKWIEGMKKESYAGAREMSDFMENMWGWQVTTPDAVDETLWEQSFEVYVEDKYGLEIKEFMNKENPWAYQSMTARMLESVRKEYWKADEKITKKLAAEYATNVVEKGVACCDHTCNNPLLNQMVVNIISLPGVLSPEMAEKFKLAVEKATGAKLEKQVEERKKLLESLKKDVVSHNAPNGKEPAKEKAQTEEMKEKRDPSPEKSENKNAQVEGYKMEEIKMSDESTKMSSSGVQWFAALFIMVLILVFTAGTRMNGAHDADRKPH